MALTITEDWVRERVQLKHDNLCDVRSLTLPGTYHEKIGNLGNSLRNFQRLKHLDLSRNGLVSLEGLEQLKLLEKLNLYYNNIAALNDLYRLRYNTNLQELDLRLNPVTQNEPDYRLFLVHMLPNLRKLDDRTVRDSERKAALTHFSTDQATDLTEHPPLPEPVQDRVPNPRAEYVKNLGKKSTALDDDDCEVLDLISRTAGDLGQPRQVTGSYAKLPSTDEHTAEDMRKMDRAEMLEDNAMRENDQPSTKYPPSPLKQSQRNNENVPLKNSSGSSHSRQVYSNSGKSIFATHQSQREKMRVQFADEVQQIRKEADANLRFRDESKAYTAYSSKANFTPAPRPFQEPDEVDTFQQISKPVEPPPAPANSVPSNGSHDRSFDLLEKRLESSGPVKRAVTPPTHDRTESVQSNPIPQSDSSDRDTDEGVLDADSPVQKIFLEKFLTLVDRYWNGSRSLHKNAKFLNLAKTVLSNYVADLNTTSQSNLDQLQADLAHFAQENVTLRGRLSQHMPSDHSRELKEALDEAQNDVAVLRSRLHQSLDENQKMKDQIASMSSMAMSGTSTVDSKQLDDLSRENEKLKFEIEKYNLQLKHHAQLQELANMLQESHKSLVTTNDHLLKELDETRKRHAQEVQQLHLSYGELKKTMEWAPGHGRYGNTPNNGGSGYERYNDVE
ncbi:centrosomal protein of 72 kDa-like isoform X2 [Ptychodera flava]|uniref:centrosomal protein of 72 kDa-like isoform X2 n=1 Tax=Ptychodera flava TaxID=63121 RepID=UPI003969F5B4